MTCIWHSVAHRTRQFEAWLKDRLENFTIHQEGQVSRIPKQVRSMTMREFGKKYDGNIQLALKGYQKERLVAAGGDATLGEIDKSMRKRKWVASQEAEAEAELSGPSQPKDSIDKSMRKKRKWVASQEGEAEAELSGSSQPKNSAANNQTTPRPVPPHRHLRSFSALVAIPTKDGHLLEFDPLQTSPGALDALEGITDSAKKHARAEMGRLMQAAVDKWKIR